MERKFIRDGRAPIPTNKEVSFTMSKIKGKNTKVEIYFRKELYKAGLSGYRLHSKYIPGRPDVAYPGKRIAIFIHGCFWHRCPFCNPPFPKTHQDFWETKFKRNIERDNEKTNELLEMGWLVFVFWECKIYKNIDEYIGQIKYAKYNRTFFH
jgi:DNA mismatch endonuclease, patch repair protein